MPLRPEGTTTLQVFANSSLCSWAISSLGGCYQEEAKLKPGVIKVGGQVDKERESRRIREVRQRGSSGFGNEMLHASSCVSPAFEVALILGVD